MASMRYVNGYTEDAWPEAAVVAGDILIVHHGEGLGRRNSYLAYLLSCAAQHAPALAARIRLHATGASKPTLDGVRAVWFFLADPLRPLYPTCFEEAAAIAEEARARDLAILNDPVSLSRTAKSEQLALWRQLGIPCAEAQRANDETELERLLEETRFPAILRSDLGHQQETAVLCDDIDAARAHASKVRFPAAVIAFVDVRETWRLREPGALMARFVHKKRVMIYGDELFHNHIFFSSDPICGLDHSKIAEADTRVRRFARAIGFKDPVLREMLDADISYAYAAPEQPDLMRRAMAALGLGVAAIDYSSYPDGSVVLWEANPYFYLHAPSRAPLTRERRIAERNWRYDAAMLRLLARLAS